MADVTASTKNLGTRAKVPIRFGNETMEAAERIAKLVPLPLNSVVALGVIMLSAQFAPHIAREGLSLDILEEELRALIADARRVVNTDPAPPRIDKLA